MLQEGVRNLWAIAAAGGRAALALCLPPVILRRSVTRSFGNILTGELHVETIWIPSPRLIAFRAILSFSHRQWKHSKQSTNLCHAKLFPPDAHNAAAVGTVRCQVTPEPCRVVLP